MAFRTESELREMSQYIGLTREVCNVIRDLREEDDATELIAEFQNLTVDYFLDAYEPDPKEIDPRLRSPFKMLKRAYSEQLNNIDKNSQKQSDNAKKMWIKKRYNSSSAEATPPKFDPSIDVEQDLDPSIDVGQDLDTIKQNRIQQLDEYDTDDSVDSSDLPW